MTPNTISRDRKPAVSNVKTRWGALMVDVTSVDGDIERIIGVYCKKLGCSRDKASAAIVRKLSWLGDGLGALQLEEAC